MVNKTVLITGAGGGIGRATVKLFSEYGWQIIGVDRNPFGEPFPDKGLYIEADISVGENLEGIFKRAQDYTDCLHALVNNAAIQISKPMLETSVDEWDAVMASNLYQFSHVKLAHPMKNTGIGAIMNMLVHQYYLMNIVAAASKEVYWRWRVPAIEFAPDNIGVNAILPKQGYPCCGRINGHVGSGNIQERLDNLARKTVNGRVGRPEEIAHAIYFLADETQSSFMTGQALIIDGGAQRLSTE
jgi:NAD(P)-dependent dehydrogenase (short-subunit alcohol dehydrogenase family)